MRRVWGRTLLGRGVGAASAFALIVPLTLIATTQVSRAQVPAPNITPTGIIGGPGHAYIYGWGTAVLNDGSILVGDYWNFQIRHYSPTGQDLGIWLSSASKGQGYGFHQSPYGMAVDPNSGDVYVGDVDNGAQVEKYDSNGNFLFAFGTLGSGPGHFTYPARIAVAADGTVAVSDQRLNQVIVDDPNGNELFRFGHTGSAAGQFSAPRGLAFGPDGALYVADSFNHRVQVFNVNVAARSATFLRQFGSQGANPGQFSGNGDLRGLAIDAVNGWVYVSDAPAGVVDKFDLAGNFLNTLGGSGTKPGKFSGGPREVAVDHNSNVWVGDLPDFSVQQFDPYGNLLLDIPTPPQPPPPGGFNSPLDLGTDQAGNIFVDDQHNQRIQKLDPNGNFLLQWGTRGAGTTKFNYPRGIAVDPANGNVVVADTDNDIVKEYDNNGKFIWQSGAFGVKPGQFSHPHALAVANDDTIWVADTQNWRIVHLSASGAFLSMFGSKGSGPGQFQFPRDVRVDPVDGTLWVTDSQLGVVDHLTTTGGMISRFGSLGSDPDQFVQAERVLVDSNYVYVSDADGNKVSVWAKDGTFLSSFGGGGTGLGEMYQPHGMAFTPVGHNLMVVDQVNERITVFATQSIQPPVAANYTAQTESGSAVAVNVLANDTDPNGSPLTVTSSGSPQSGGATCTGSGTCTYTPSSGFSGSDSFTYTIRDGLGGTATGTVSVQVLSPLSLVSTLGGPEHAQIYPSGVDVAPDGTVVVTDIGNNMVKKFTAGGTLVWATGGFGTGVGQFQHPRDVGVDPATGNSYVADADNSRIVELGPDGSWLRSFQGPAGDQISFPLGVSFANGQVVVADTGRHKVRVFDTSGNQLAALGATGTCQLGNLRDATEDASGNIYAADYTADTISKLSSGGQCLLTWGSKGGGPGQLAAPYGIAVGTDPVLGTQAVYVADANNERMQEFDLNGNFVTTAGSPGPDGQAGTGTMFQMRKVAVAPDGSVWTADLWGWLVDHYTRNASGYSFAGSIGTVLAPPTATSVFHEPRGIAFEGDGTVDVMDTVHQRVVRMNPNGQIASYCGIRGAALGAFNWPRGVAVDPATGNLWVADTKSYRLQVIKPDNVSGAVACDGGIAKIGGFGTALGQFNWVYSDAVDPTDSVLWVADTVNNRIVSVNMHTKQVVSSFGTPLTGGPSATALNSPSGVAYDAFNGHILVADSANNRVEEFSNTGGSNITLVAQYTGFHNPMGVAADKAGHIFVADTGNNQVVVLNSDGTSNAVITGGFNDPENVAFNTTTNQLYVADTMNDRVLDYAGLGGSATPPPPPDTTPPTVAVTTPQAGQTVPAPVSVSGTVTDNQSVASVSVAVKDRNTNLYAQPGGTWAATYVAFPASVTSPGTTSSPWSLSFTPGAGGSGAYVLLVTATDTAGNTTPTKLSVKFNVSP